MPRINKNLLLCAALAMRIIFFAYGLYQDATSVVKYTDIDYYVFHDAAGYVYHGLSPYLRDTYRYTPLLAWMLVPNFYWTIHFGKFLFVLCDLVSGYIILQMTNELCASVWLLNPMVVTISTRGNAESVLCCFVLLAMYYLTKGKAAVAGIWFGLSVHFKIYPIIYAWPVLLHYTARCQWRKLVTFAMCSIAVLVAVTYYFYTVYGEEYLFHAYTYHLARLDHRHNFSVWNLSLYAASTGSSDIAKWAFVPQMLIVFAAPLVVRDLMSCLFIQTFAFVTFNKVCTSQYFIWYLVFLPFYLRKCRFSWLKGAFMILVWVLSQAMWLFFAYKLEFLGENTFFPGLFLGNVVFFLGNVYMLGEFISDAAF